MARKKREIHPGVAREKAAKWLEIRLLDEEKFGEFWDNYQDLLEEPPDLAELLALAPQVLEALKTGQRLPTMSLEVRDAFAAYLEEYDSDIAASELANTDEEIRDDWTGAVMETWTALRQPLDEAHEQDLARQAEISPEDIAAAGALWDANAPEHLKGLLE